MPSDKLCMFGWVNYGKNEECLRRVGRSATFHPLVNVYNLNTDLTLRSQDLFCLKKCHSRKSISSKDIILLFVKTVFLPWLKLEHVARSIETRESKFWSPFSMCSLIACCVPSPCGQIMHDSSERCLLWSYLTREASAITRHSSRSFALLYSSLSLQGQLNSPFSRKR